MRVRTPGVNTSVSCESGVSLTTRGECLILRLVRALRLVPVLAAVPLVLGTWASASNGAAPRCTSKDTQNPILVVRGGYILACGRGSAVVRTKGTTYRIPKSKCFGGARLNFGVRRPNADPRLAPSNSLGLVIEPSATAGAVEVIDGVIEIVTANGSTVSGAISGKAHVAAGRRRGTFNVLGRSGTAEGRRFTGSWDCGPRSQ